MEQQQVAFTTMLHSATKARRFVADLQKQAAATPFEFSDLTRASQVLLGFGYSAKQTKGLLNDLGDATSALGGGGEKLQSLALILGQINAKGRLQGDEVLQLAENGVSAQRILQKQLHLTSAQFQKELSKGAISASVAVQALSRGFHDLYGGGMAKQSRTFAGQLSTLKDNSNAAMGALTRPLFNLLRRQGFPALNKQIQKASKYLASSEFQHGAAGVFKDIGQFASDAGPRLLSVLRGVGSAVGNVAQAFGPLLLDVTRLGASFLSSKLGIVAMSAALGGLAGRFVGLGIASVVSGFLSLVASARAAGGAITALNVAVARNPIGLIATGVGIAIGALTGLSRTNREAKFSADEFTDALNRQRDAIRALNDLPIEKSALRAQLLSGRAGVATAKNELSNARASGDRLRIQQAEAGLAEARANLSRVTREWSRWESHANDVRRAANAETRKSAPTVQKNIGALSSEIRELREYRNGLAGVIRLGKRTGMTEEVLNKHRATARDITAQIAAKTREYNRALGRVPRSIKTDLQLTVNGGALGETLRSLGGTLSNLGAVAGGTAAPQSSRSHSSSSSTRRPRLNHRSSSRIVIENHNNLNLDGRNIHRSVSAFERDLVEQR